MPPQFVHDERIVEGCATSANSRSKIVVWMPLSRRARIRVTWSPKHSLTILDSKQASGVVEDSTRNSACLFDPTDQGEPKRRLAQNL